MTMTMTAKMTMMALVTMTAPTLSMMNNNNGDRLERVTEYWDDHDDGVDVDQMQETSGMPKEARRASD